MTAPPDTQPAAETLEEIAERIATRAVGRNPNCAKDIVEKAHELLGQHSRIHALNDSDPDKDVDVAWMISALADEVERLRQQRKAHAEMVDDYYGSR